MPFAPDEKYGGRMVVEQLDAERWQLVVPLAYKGNEQNFLVPAGYISDLASVPRITAWLVPKNGLYSRAAVLHDYLLTDALKVGKITSNDADGLFRKAMRELGVPRVKRWLMWTGVRWGALFNAARRPGWHRSAPGVLAISAPALLLVLIPALAVGAGLVVYGAAEWIATGGRTVGTSST